MLNEIEVTLAGNKLFCTFTQKNDLNSTIDFIQNSYTILYSKIFVLSAAGTEELICTYNIDYNNVNESKLIDNTILTHRRKETNTLYTINSLNALIAKLNNNVVDKNFVINWDDYRNSILLTRRGIFTKLDTEIFDIVHLEKKY